MCEENLILLTDAYWTFQGKPMLFTYCSVCAGLSQETCETYSPEEQQGCCQAHKTLRNENGREVFAMPECFSASLCQAGQSGNNSECTSIGMSALPAMLTLLAWVLWVEYPRPTPDTIQVVLPKHPPAFSLPHTKKSFHVFYRTFLLSVQKIQDSSSFGHCDVISEWWC